MSETLVPSVETLAKIAALAGDGGFSVLVITSPTNPDISCLWYGDEVVTDPGFVFSTRAGALDVCDMLEVEGAQATAFVRHRSDGGWAVFINPGRLP